MKKKVSLIILILAMVLLGSMVSFAETASEAAGPGVFSSSKIGKVPRIVAAPATVTGGSGESAEKDQAPVTGAGEALDAPAELGDTVGTVETEVLSTQRSWEERVAADLLLTEMPRPFSGELFHSTDYLSTSATVVINNIGTDDTLMKFFSEEELVFIAYIRKGEKVNVQVPGGYYRMKQAFGEKWYGNGDLFGSCGRYCECSINGNELFNIKRGAKYIISTQGQGDAFSKKEVLKENF